MLTFRITETKIKRNISTAEIVLLYVVLHLVQLTLCLSRLNNIIMQVPCIVWPWYSAVGYISPWLALCEPKRATGKYLLLKVGLR